ncbi:transforming acidic coiled-coil-containing protein 1, partial [Biomphalaria pfeifferi]
KPSRPSPSHTPKVLKQREDDAVLNTPPQGKKVEDSYLTPESPQKDISRGSGKNESSSEDSQFYDAFDYPPAPSTKSKLGQKNSIGMERGSSSQDEGGNNKDAVVQLVQVLRYSQSDWKKMKQELELNFQASLLNKEREWSLMLGERDKKILSLEDANAKLKHTNDEMRMIVADFEKTISQLQAEKDKTKTDSKEMIQTLESERDQAVEDLQSVESAFSDLHRRYEKSKSIIEGFKRNEEQLKQCVEDLQGKLKKAEGKLQAIRSQAEEKLDKANEDIEKIKKSTKQDIIRLEAALKKAELRTSNLEESLQRKEKENQELTAICDELISKVGS